MSDQNTALLEAVRARQQKNTEFNTGILTADRYVRTLEECIGSELCNRYACSKEASYEAVVKAAAATLTYNHPEMKLEDIYGKDYEWKDMDGDTLTLPKNTLMVFKHILTTPKKDRDNDILRTDGAKPDPKMLLLWQHVHTLPIGKMLTIVEHTKNVLKVVSAIIDINDLAHDAAVMVDNDMGRFSHGFRALEFIETKSTDGLPGGFDVKSFEIMEESLVSVPSNTDAAAQEIFVSLVERGKLTSPMMKSWGRNLREAMPKQFNIPINLDLNLSLNGKSIGEQNGTKAHDPIAKQPAAKDCGGTCGGGCGCDSCSGASEETDDKAKPKPKDPPAADKKVKPAEKTYRTPGEKAMAEFLATATDAEQMRMMDTLQTLKTVEQKNRITQNVKSLIEQ